MIPLPIQYLHLETGILLIFIAMLLWTQLQRVSEPGYYTQSGRVQGTGLMIGFAALLILFMSQLYSVSPLLAVELAAGVILSLLHPVNALCFFVHLLFLRPWEIATDNALLLALPRLLAALCMISWFLHPREHAHPNARAYQGFTLLLFFSGWLFLTTFKAANIVETQIGWIDTFFKSLVVFVMCLYVIESERSVAEFKLTFVISAAALMAVRLYQYRTEGPGFIRLQTGGMFGDPNDLAAVIVIALPFALAPVFRKAALLGQQILGCLFGGISVIVIWLAQSRGAMLALVTQVLTVGTLKSRMKRSLSLLVLVGLLGAGYYAAIKAIPRESGEMRASSRDRITYWKTAVNMALHHPLLGVGYDEYSANYEAYRMGATTEWGLRTAHSSWFLAFAESGIPGGILFVAFFVFTLRTAWRDREQHPDLLISLAGYGIVMSFLSHTYVMNIFLLSGLIMASDSLKNRADRVLDHER